MDITAPPSWRRMEWAVAAGLLVFAAGLALAGAWGGGRQAWHTLLQVPRGILPLMLALSACNYAARGCRWLLFSRALHLPVPPRINALYYVAGFSMTTTPGKLGEALRLYLLNRSHGCAYDRTAALLIADRLADGLATALVVALTVGAFAHYAWIAFAALGLAAFLTFLTLRPGWVLLLLDQAYARLRRWPRLFVRARRTLRALRRLASPRIFAAAIALSVAGWASEGFSLHIVLEASGAPIAPAAAIFVFGFSMLVGALTIVPGGLGTTEATMIGLLATAGVPFPVALVATAVVRLTTLWFAVGLGLLALPLALRPVRPRLAAA